VHESWTQDDEERYPQLHPRSVAAGRGGGIPRRGRDESSAVKRASAGALARWEGDVRRSWTVPTRSDSIQRDLLDRLGSIVLHRSGAFHRDLRCPLLRTSALFPTRTTTTARANRTGRHATTTLPTFYATSALRIPRNGAPRRTCFSCECQDTASSTARAPTPTRSSTPSSNRATALALACPASGSLRLQREDRPVEAAPATSTAARAATSGGTHPRDT
jgi:hypothetical protein